jgi:hypothetical protein
MLVPHGGNSNSGSEYDEILDSRINSTAVLENGGVVLDAAFSRE